MFDIRSVSDETLTVAVADVYAGATHTPIGDRWITGGTVTREVRRRGLPVDPPPSVPLPAARSVGWTLKVDEYDNFLCPLADGEGGLCHASLVLEGSGWIDLAPDLPADTDFTTAPVQTWNVRCTEGHVLEIGPNDGGGAPPFRLAAFLAGTSYEVAEDDGPAAIVTELAVGDEVEFTGAQCGASDPLDGTGKVTEIKGDVVTIEADDDSTVWAQIDHVKQLAPDDQPAPVNEETIAYEWREPCPTCAALMHLVSGCFTCTTHGPLADQLAAGAVRYAGPRYATNGDTRRAIREIRLVQWSRLPGVPEHDAGYLPVGSVFTVLDPKVATPSPDEWAVSVAISGYDGEYLLSYAAHEQSEPYAAEPEALVRFRCINCELMVPVSAMVNSCPAVGSHGHVVSADLGGPPEHPYLTVENQPGSAAGPVAAQIETWLAEARTVHDGWRTMEPRDAARAAGTVTALERVLTIVSLSDEVTAAAVRLALSVMEGDAVHEPRSDAQLAAALTVLRAHATRCADCNGDQHDDAGLLCAGCSGAGWTTDR